MKQSLCLHFFPPSGHSRQRANFTVFRIEDSALRDVNPDLLNQFLEKDINPNLLEYHFTNKKIEKEKLVQDPYESMALKINEIQKKDSNINNIDGNTNQSNSKKTISNSNINKYT